MNFILAILQRVVGWVIGPLITYIGGLIASAIQRYIERKRAKSEAEKRAQEVLDRTNAATTKEERDKAAEETIRNF